MYLTDLKPKPPVIPPVPKLEVWPLQFSSVLMLRLISQTKGPFTQGLFFFCWNARFFKNTFTEKLFRKKYPVYTATLCLSTVYMNTGFTENMVLLFLASYCFFKHHVLQAFVFLSHSGSKLAALLQAWHRYSVSKLSVWFPKTVH